MNDPLFRADPIGMPSSHATAFAEVAEEQSVLIISRAVGPTCLQLLEQGYDTKGFRIHGKSCDWGPMAGFVLRDPRLNKARLAKEKYNRHEHHTAMHDTGGSGWRASTTPLKITEARRRWLLRHEHIGGLHRVSADEYSGIESSGVPAFAYRLIRERCPLSGNEVWGVYFDISETQHAFRQETLLPRETKDGRPDLEPMLAMTNPPDHRSYPEGHYLNAVTGDYDLFAIWPTVEDYDPTGLDRRIFGTVRVLSRRKEIDDMESDFVDTSSSDPSATRSRQSTKLGNMTDRIYLVSQILNSAIGILTTSDGVGGLTSRGTRNVLWHSTESARPYVFDLDLPLIAFMPSNAGVQQFGIESISDFEHLIAAAITCGFRPLLAEGWVHEPRAKYMQRLGRKYRHLVPRDVEGGPIKVAPWYNM